MVSPLPRRGAEQLESRWDRTFFTTFGMEDRGPKACGPCVALASEQCQANPNRHTIYTFVPEEYHVEHSLNASAAVCRSHLCHAKVRLRAEPNPPGRPLGWQKRTREAAEVVLGTIAKSEHVRQRPAIVNEIFQIKASRCATPAVPCLCLCPFATRH